MATTVTGRVFNVQRFCLHDGPGIRTTVFLKGCPLSCAWCHNPEGRDGVPQLRVISSRCVRCGECVDVCPQQDDARTAGDVSVHCAHCGRCVEVCPTGARELVGREASVEEIVRDVLRDRLFFDQSRGGVTISGGEPLVQAEFTRTLLDALGNEAIHRALDTCGHAPTETFLDVAQRADLVLYDIKALDERVHLQYTGVTNTLIVQNLQALAAMHDHIWVRIPLIPGVNTGTNALREMARFIAPLAGIQQVNLLPYHAFGTGKMAAASRRDGRDGSRKPTADELQRAQRIFRAAGLTTCVGG